MTDPKPKAKRNVSATVPADLADWLKAQAEKEQRTVGVVVMRAIMTYRQAVEANGRDEAALPISETAAKGTP
jgi:hypothetical protein